MARPRRRLRGGSFIPYLAELVGPQGKVTALDHAPENIEVVQKRLEASPQSCPVEPLQGGILDAPLPDNAVDAVWLANVLMYFVEESCRLSWRSCSG
ncbi:MAG: class I SAM-dependent methyltransferase [Thermomicrobiales bacterium]